MLENDKSLGACLFLGNSVVYTRLSYTTTRMALCYNTLRPLQSMMNVQIIPVYTGSYVHTIIMIIAIINSIDKTLIY